MAHHGVSLHIRSAISKGRIPLLAMGAAFLLSHCAAPKRRQPSGLHGEVEFMFPEVKADEADVLIRHLAEKRSMFLAPQWRAYWKF